MRMYTRNLILIASTLTILFACPTLQASTITLSGNPHPNYGYQGIPVGPYVATLEDDPNNLVFCLDLHINSYVNTAYAGTLSRPGSQEEKEAAYLAAYSLYLGAPSASLVQTVQGPISMAIWQIMGTLDLNGNHTPPDPAAAPYIRLAESAYSSGRISDEFLSDVKIWSPASGVNSQRFITAVRDDDLFESTVPEPGTWIFLGSGILLMGLSRIGRRR